MNAIQEKSYKVHVADMPQSHDPAILGKTLGTFLPYDPLSLYQRHIYEAFFKESTAFESYDDVIPETAMTLAKEIIEMPDYKKEKPKALEGGEKQYSFTLYIWHAPSKVKDPILVCKKVTYTGNGSYVWSDSTYYLVAQWWDGLLSFDEVRNIVTENIKDAVVSFGRRMKVFSELAIADSDWYVNRLLAWETIDFESELNSLLKHKVSSWDF